MVEYEKSTDTPESEPKNTQYEPKLTRSLDELIEISSINKHGLPHSFGATPLNRIATREYQDKLIRDLIGFTDIPPESVPRDTAYYIRRLVYERFVSRCSANDENYQEKLIDRDSYDDFRLYAIFDRGELGEASPAELLLIRSLLGIRSVELACLTHPYGRRMELLDEMHEVVDDAIISMGGELFDRETPRLRIKSVVLGDITPENMACVYSYSDQERIKVASQYGGVTCLLITMKRDIGRMPDDTIIRGRVSFCLRTDPGSSFGNQSLQGMANLDSDHWDDKALVETGMDKVIFKMIKEKQFDQVIPISSTIFAFNRDTQDLIEAMPDRKLESSDAYSQSILTTKTLS